jgi:hypothetical protein
MEKYKYILRFGMIKINECNAINQLTEEAMRAIIDANDAIRIRFNVIDDYLDGFINIKHLQ